MTTKLKLIYLINFLILGVLIGTLLYHAQDIPKNTQPIGLDGVLRVSVVFVLLWLAGYITAKAEHSDY